MNIQLQDQLFIVGGATSGFGKAVTNALVAEGANVIAIARGASKVKELEDSNPSQIQGVVGDLTKSEVIQELVDLVGDRELHGILVNAGGPPAMSFMETKLQDWDDAYQNVLRWKIEMTQTFLPKFIQQKYGRILYVESVSVKQPVENLVLSNSLRLGVVGFVKTLSQEVAHHGINLNIFGPGYHATPAMNRLFKKKSEVEGISVEEARAVFEKQTKVGKMGDPNDFASLALWFLSPMSQYITGQTISLDGGLIKGSFG